MSFIKSLIMSNGARSMHLHKNDLFGLILRITVACAVSYYGFKYLVNILDPTRKQKLEAQRKAREIMERLGISHDHFKLSEYEMIIATHLVEPLNMSVTWKDIAGLDDIIQEMQETIILPIKSQTLFQTSKLIQPPKGVLLHGPPGCGKTLLAKATAKEAGTRFINLQVSSLTDKWYGESQKLAAAVFSLAVKLQPTIIFIDEIDSFLRSRDTHDHEATAMMKAQFMSLWDGLCTDHNCIVIVMGATNRPQDIDKAILRRMPATFHVGLPSLAQRKHIIQLILDSEPVAADVDIDKLANKTENFSGSDLRELCRNAAVYRVKDYLATSVDDASGKTDCDHKSNVESLRSIKMDDFLNALNKIKESKVCTN